MDRNGWKWKCTWNWTWKWSWHANGSKWTWTWKWLCLQCYGKKSNGVSWFEPSFPQLKFPFFGIPHFRKKAYTCRESKWGTVIEHTLQMDVSMETSTTSGGLSIATLLEGNNQWGLKTAKKQRQGKHVGGTLEMHPGNSRWFILGIRSGLSSGRLR